jgi:HEPN domain-containing protein
VTNSTLAQSYLVKATKRLKILPVLLAEEAFSDVLREAQEIVELALKGMLRQVGIEPPKWHDVGGLLLEFADRFPESLQASLSSLATTSAWLRKEREFSFYGDVDFIPTERYTAADAEKAIAETQIVVAAAAQVIPEPGGPADPSG